jgi:hypothetical protein
MIHNKQLQENGHLITKLPLPDELETLVDNEDWNQIDNSFQKLLSQNGELYKALKEFGSFNETEFIISVRDANDPEQDDGIWHDDGSRNFAFSLSLTKKALNINGGDLSYRKKNNKQTINIPTPEYSNAIIFLTGIHGYEHKINQVTQGKRIVIAGWLS